MLTNWVWSPETESIRILHDAQQIACGFMPKNGLPVLDFPDLDWKSIPHFWKRVAKISDKGFPIADQKLISSATALLTQANLIHKPDTSKIEKLWANNESKILAQIHDLIPSSKIKSITIYPTNFGQFTMFSLDKIEFYFPKNLGLYEIVWTIVTCLTRQDIYKNLDATWGESQLLSDWVLSRTRLAKFIPTGPSALLMSRQKQNGKLRLQNQEFLKKLGAPVSFVATDLTKLDLNFREKQIMEKLAAAKERIVSFDTIAEIVCPTEDRYSLYAISKAIQRLRCKLPHESLIQTVRGQGYLLVN